MTTDDSHELIKQARDAGGVPEIKEPHNPSCRTMFRYEGMSKWYPTPRAAAVAFLDSLNRN